MESLIEYFDDNNVKNKFLVRSEDVKSKMNKLISISVFKTLKNQILEVLGDDEILFGLEEVSSGIIFTKNYFIICGGSSGLKKFDYRIFLDITLQPKSLTKKGCYMLNNEQLFGLGTTKKEFIDSFEDLKEIISKIKFDNSKDPIENYKERSINLTGLGGLKNKNFRIEEYQRDYKLQVINLNELDKLISDNEKEIISKENGHENLQKFIRLRKFVTKLRENVLNELTIGKNKSVKWWEEFILMNHINLLERNNKNLEDLNNISIYLIKNFLDDKMVEFFKIYEGLDELGVFNTGFENKLLDELSSLNEKLETISKKLTQINSKLTYLNIITTYNTYQLRTIRKKM